MAAITPYERPSAKPKHDPRGHRTVKVEVLSRKKTPDRQEGERCPSKKARDSKPCPGGRISRRRNEMTPNEIIGRNRRNTRTIAVNPSNLETQRPNA